MILDGHLRSTLELSLTNDYHWPFFELFQTRRKSSHYDHCQPILCSIHTHSLFWFEDCAKDLITITTQGRLISSSFECRTLHWKQFLVNRTVTITNIVFTIFYHLTAAGQASTEVVLFGQNWLNWDRVFFSEILKGIDIQRFNRPPFLIIRQISKLYWH